MYGYTFAKIKLALTIIADRVDPGELKDYQWSELGYSNAWLTSFATPTTTEMKASAIEVIADCMTDMLAEIEDLKSEIRRKDE